MCCRGSLVGGVRRYGGLGLLSRPSARRRGDKFPGFWDGIQVSFAFRQPDEKVLSAEGRAVFRARSATVGTVGLLEARLHGVGEVRGKDLVMDARLYCWISDREDDFAPLKEITRHPVG